MRQGHHVMRRIGFATLHALHRNPRSYPLYQLFKPPPSGRTESSCSKTSPCDASPTDYYSMTFRQMDYNPWSFDYDADRYCSIYIYSLLPLHPSCFPSRFSLFNYLFNSQRQKYFFIIFFTFRTYIFYKEFLNEKSIKVWEKSSKRRIYFSSFFIYANVDKRLILNCQKCSRAKES